MLSGSLSFQEYMVAEPLPLATLHEAVLDFLRGRDDVVLFGAQAVNAFVGEPRMTQHVDLISLRAAELATELRDHLASRFSIAVRLREIGDARASGSIRCPGRAIVTWSTFAQPERCRWPAGSPRYW